MATTAEEQAAPWLGGRSFASWQEEFDRRGYLIFERALPQDRVAEIRPALAPHLARDLKGRNDFEGVKTNRVYALLAKSPVFAELVARPLAMAFVDAEWARAACCRHCLGSTCNPGETVQPWHFDDSGAKIPRPRPPLGVSTFWAIDDTTELNGATEIDEPSLGQRHHRGRGEAYRVPQPRRQVRDRRPRGRDQDDHAVGVAGDHQGNALTPWRANRSDHPPLIITSQYCVGWMRQLENMCLAVPPEIADKLPERVRELIGYSIHPPFMGHVDGVHPKRLLRTI